MTPDALTAVLVREAKIRATNWLFIFWDLVYPLGYLLVFGIGVNASLAFTSGLAGIDYNAFFLAGVLGMASFGIASNTSWSFFLDRDNGIFYEMLTYPMRRWEHLLGKVLFNALLALAQALLTLVLATALLDVPVRFDRLPLLAAATLVGTAGWFFFGFAATTPTTRSRPSSILCFCSPARCSIRSTRSRERSGPRPTRTRSPGRSTCSAMPRSASASSARSRSKPSRSRSSRLSRLPPRCARSGTRANYVPGARCHGAGPRCQVPGAGCRVPGAGCRVPGATVLSRCHATLAPGALWYAGTLALLHRGTLAPWHAGTVARWHRGTVARS
jgi:ABC-type transport system involved in cytochrome c biogenesis permease component